MTTTFEETRQQFSASQKKLADTWEETQKQFSESQKKLVYTWLESIPSGMIQVNFSENFDKAINVQQEVVNTAFKAQEVAIHLVMEAQKQFWDNYFKVTRKTAQETPNSKATW